MSLPNIFTHLEYRRYLEDYFRARKEQEPAFSHRTFSRLCGVATPNYLLLIIQGKRNLGETNIAGVSSALGHTAREAAYFRQMVEFDQAATVEAKALHFRRMAKSREPYEISALDQTRLSHYKNWYNLAIRELLGFYPFDPSDKYAYRRLASMLSPSITETQARAAVRQMLKLGLLKRQASGRIVQSERFLSTGDEVKSLFVRAQHRAMGEMGIRSLDLFPPELRDVSGLTISISDHGFQVLKEEMQLFRKRLLERVKQDRDPGHVYQINFQMFPLTHVRRVRKALAGREGNQS